METNNDWDDIIMLEEHFYKEGQQEALKDADHTTIIQTARHEGYQAGFLRGSTIGFELGFYSIAIGDETEERRQRKLLQDLKLKTENFPRSNHADTDFDSTIQSMRALYRGLGSKLGKFPPSTLMKKEGEDGGEGKGEE
eukprot:gene4942-5425_t